MKMTDASMDWTRLVDEQLTWWWDWATGPRFSGLTDDEYFWEPAPGAWSIRREGESPWGLTAGGGPYRADFAVPEPDPPPVTTIAWRLAHLVVGVFGIRAASHFGGPPCDYG